MGDGTDVSKKYETAVFWGVVGLLYGMQTLYAYAYYETSLQNRLGLQMAIRLLTWTVPVFVYLVWFGYDVLGFLKLGRHVAAGWVWGLVIGAGLIGLHTLGLLVVEGKIEICRSISAAGLMKAVVLAGLSEEILFRGLILQKLRGWMVFWQANLVCSVLFVLIHFPGWFLAGRMGSLSVLRLIVPVFLLSLLLGWTVRKTDSLWSCILVHAINNFCSLVIVPG